MTHVKQVEAFERLVTFCTGYGGSYNPGRPTLQIDALQNQLIEVKSAIEKAKLARTEFDSEVNQRKQAFDKLPRLLSGIMLTLEASGAKPEKLEDARSFVHQITGSSRKNRKPIPAKKPEKPAIQRSHLQLAYVSKADTFSKLVKTVLSEPLYQPHEKTFSVAGLESKVAELHQLNRQTADARGKWRKVLVERNRIMYAADGSLTESARAVKKYVRAIYGHDSQEYALVKVLDFKKPKNR